MIVLGWNAASEQHDPLDMLDQVVTAEKAGKEPSEGCNHCIKIDIGL